jgi:hypothetical protein
MCATTPSYNNLVKNNVASHQIIVLKIVKNVYIICFFIKKKKKKKRERKKQKPAY